MAILCINNVIPSTIRRVRQQRISSRGCIIKLFKLLLRLKKTPDRTGEREALFVMGVLVLAVAVVAALARAGAVRAVVPAPVIPSGGE